MKIADAQVHIGTDDAFTLTELDLVRREVGIDHIILDEFQGFTDTGDLMPSEPLAGGGRRYSCPISDEAYAFDPKSYSHVRRVHRLDPDMDDIIRAAPDHPGFAAFRVFAAPGSGELEAFAEGGYDSLFASLEKYQVPVFVYNSWGSERDLLTPLLVKFPDLRILFDHLGMEVFQQPIARGDFTAVDRLLRIGIRFDTLHVKLSHGPRLSAEPYPFADWALQVRRILDVFGSGRVAWASDVTIARFAEGGKVIPYGQLLYYLLDSPLFTEDEKADIFGRTIKSFCRLAF